MSSFNPTSMGLGGPGWGEGRVAQNAAEFSRQLVALSQQIRERAELAIKKGVFDLYTRIAERTPHDTGRASASWHLSLDENSSFVAPEQGLEVGTIAQLVAGHAEGFDFRLEDGVVYIINNLEYVEALENGHSRQAPQGMVAVSLAEFTAHFEGILRDLGLAA